MGGCDERQTRRHFLQKTVTVGAAVAGMGAGLDIAAGEARASGPPSDVFYVTNQPVGLDNGGSYRLRDNQGNKIVLKGINLPLNDDWDFPQQRPTGRLDQLAKSGANCVRIMLRAVPEPGRPPYSAADLDRVLDACRATKKIDSLIPIIELHDCTGEPDAELVNTQLMSWWTRPDILAILKRHQRYLIINLANELGWYHNLNSTPTALSNFQNAYEKAITTIRNNGLRLPIMIDAPDYGTSVDAFLRIGQQLIDHDPQHNILLSTHAYWGGKTTDYNGFADLQKAVEIAKLPIVVGEVANKQPEGNDQCYYDIDQTSVRPPTTGHHHQSLNGFTYQELLIYLTQFEVGWLAWSWGPDDCEDRRITIWKRINNDTAWDPSSGQYIDYLGGPPILEELEQKTNLTEYGLDILHNATYGLRLGLYGPQKTDSLPGPTPPPP